MKILITKKIQVEAESLEEAAASKDGLTVSLIAEIVRDISTNTPRPPAPLPRRSVRLARPQLTTESQEK